MADDVRPSEKTVNLSGVAGSNDGAPKRRVSVAVIVSLALVLVSTTLLGATGFFFYRSESAQLHAELRRQLDRIADQLSVGLRLPLWNFDRDQVRAVLESSMQDREIASIEVFQLDRSAAEGAAVLSFDRDERWNPVERNRLLDSQGSLIAERQILVSGDEPGAPRTTTAPSFEPGDRLGSLRLTATSRFVEERLRQYLFSIVLLILVLDLALIAGLYSALWIFVIRPLRSIESAAAVVSSLGRAGAGFGQLPVRFTEFESMKQSLEKMVGLLDKRYEAIQQLNATLEERVRLRTEELQELNDELEAFSYSVSHDLKTPLRSLNGFSRMLILGYADKLDDEARRHLDRIAESALRMGELIDDLLRLSHVSRCELKIVEVDLSAMAAEIIESFRESAPDRKAEIVVEPGMIVRGDRTLLRTALENLLGNAWKYTSRKSETHIQFCKSVSNGQTSYFVRDNGAGFKMAYAHNLFMPFQRLHKAAEFPGTGIGLATVHRIVRRHGGTIVAESVENISTTFTFTLSAG